MNHPLWLFWSGDHLTFLRWATIATAAKIHDEVILVRRVPDSALHEDENIAALSWHERQDFQRHVIFDRNWMDDIPPSVKQVKLEDVAPEIAAIRAPDVQTSDLLAWWLLAHHGGTMADMDVTFFRPVPPITRDIQVVECTGWPKPGYMPIGFLQGHPCQFWKDMFRRACERYDPRVYQSCGAELLPPFREIQGDKMRLPEHVVYPFALLSEWMNWHPWMFETLTWPEIPETCCGIHWYGGFNQEHNWSLTPENLPEAKGAVPWVIRKMLGAEVAA